MRISWARCTISVIDSSQIADRLWEKWNDLQDMDIVSHSGCGDGKATVSSFKKKEKKWVFYSLTGRCFPLSLPLSQWVEILSETRATGALTMRTRFWNETRSFPWTIEISNCIQCWVASAGSNKQFYLRKNKAFWHELFFWKSLKPSKTSAQQEPSVRMQTKELKLNFFCFGLVWFLCSFKAGGEQIAIIWVVGIAITASLWPHWLFYFLTPVFCFVDLCELLVDIYLLLLLLTRYPHPLG